MEKEGAEKVMTLFPFFFPGSGDLLKNACAGEGVAAVIALLCYFVIAFM